MEEKRVRYKEEESELRKEGETGGGNGNSREAKRRKRSVMEGKEEEGMVLEWNIGRLKVGRKKNNSQEC